MANINYMSRVFSYKHMIPHHVLRHGQDAVSPANINFRMV